MIFKQWRQARKEIRKKQEWNRGYDWAMCEYFQGQICLEDLYRFTETMDYGPFDAGVDAACIMITALNLSEEDEIFRNTPADEADDEIAHDAREHLTSCERVKTIADRGAHYSVQPRDGQVKQCILHNQPEPCKIKYGRIYGPKGNLISR